MENEARPHDAPTVGAVMLLSIAAVGGSFLLYGHVLDLSFFSEDFSFVQRAGVGQQEGPTGFFRPLLDRSITLCYVLFGDAPGGYRAFNVLVHGMTCAVLMLFTERLPGRRPLLMAIIAGSLFLCYPYHNEVVIWIVGRGASMATLFTLVFLWLLLARLPAIHENWLTSTSLFIGLLAYESALLMPLLALPVLWMRRTPTHRSVALLTSWLGIIGLYFLMRSIWTDVIVNEYGSSMLGHRPSTYLTNIPKVVGRLFLPPNEDQHVQKILFSMLIVCFGMIGARFKNAIRADQDTHKQVIMLILMILVACSLGFIGGVSTRTSESERFLYMPSAFLCVLLALLIHRMLERRHAAISLSILLSGSLVGLHHSTLNWISASRIIRSCIATIPDAPKGHRLLIVDLPGELAGAFMFRNGFHDAMLLAGRDTTGMVPVHALPDNAGSIGDRFVMRSGDTLVHLDGDRVHVCRHN